MADEIRTTGRDEAADPVAIIADAVEAAGGREKMAERFGVRDIRLSKPFEWCGKTYETIHMDFAALTGVDLEAIDEELGPRAPIFQYADRQYLRILAAKASKVPSDAIQHLPAIDYLAVTGAARAFLLV